MVNKYFKKRVKINIYKKVSLQFHHPKKKKKNPKNQFQVGYGYPWIKIWVVIGYGC